MFRFFLFLSAFIFSCAPVEERFSPDQLVGMTFQGQNSGGLGEITKTSFLSEEGDNETCLSSFLDLTFLSETEDPFTMVYKTQDGYMVAVWDETYPEVDVGFCDEFCESLEESSDIWLSAGLVPDCDDTNTTEM